MSPVEHCNVQLLYFDCMTAASAFNDNQKLFNTQSRLVLDENTCLSILETDLSTVHPDLFSSLDDIGRSQVEQLLRRLGVKTWNPKDLVNSHIIPTFKSDKWQVYKAFLVS